MKVLYLSPFAAFGGATRSLLEVLQAIPADVVEKHAIVSQGTLAKGWYPEDVKLSEVRGLTQWDNTRFSHYRRWRWLILLRELLNLPATVKVLRNIHPEERPDIIHCNEITLLPSALLAKRILKAPLVLHVRSLQAGNRTPLRTRIITKLIEDRVDALIAIDQSVARTLAPQLDPKIIYNCMSVPRSKPKLPYLGMPLRIGVIGSLSVAKGVLETVLACIELKLRGVPVKLIIAGENVRSLKGLKGRLLKLFGLARDIEKEIKDLITEHGLEETVTMLGFVKDVTPIYEELDVLCFTSHLDAPGRPVFEAALYGVPALVVMQNPANDIIQHDVTGLCISKPRPKEIADSLEILHGDRVRLRAMGDAARAASEVRFDCNSSAKCIIETYERVLALRICASSAGDVVENSNSSR